MTKDQEKQLGRVAFMAGCIVLFWLCVFALAAIGATVAGFIARDWVAVVLGGLLSAVVIGLIIHSLKRL